MYNVRAADRLVDIYHLVTLDQQCFGPFGRGAEWWNETLLNHEVIVATFYNTPVGFIVIQHDHDRIATVSRFGVRHFHRRKGLARRMFAMVGGAGCRITLPERAVYDFDGLLGKVFSGLGLQSKLLSGKYTDQDGILFMSGLACD